MKKKFLLFVSVFIFCMGVGFSNDFNLVDSIWYLALNDESPEMISLAKKNISSFCIDWQNADQDFRTGLFSLIDDTRETCLSFALVIQTLNSLQDFIGIDYISKIENALDLSSGDLWRIQQQIISSCDVFNEQNQKEKKVFINSPTLVPENVEDSSLLLKHKNYLRAEEILLKTELTDELVYEIISNYDLFFIMNNSKRYNESLKKIFAIYFLPDEELAKSLIISSSDSKVKDVITKLKIAGRLRFIVNDAEKLSRQYGLSLQPIVSPLSKQIGLACQDSSSSMFPKMILSFSTKDFDNAIKQYTEACSIISSIGQKSFLLALREK